MVASVLGLMLLSRRPLPTLIPFPGAPAAVEVPTAVQPLLSVAGPSGRFPFLPPLSPLLVLSTLYSLAAK